MMIIAYNLNVEQHVRHYTLSRYYLIMPKRITYITDLFLIRNCNVNLVKILFHVNLSILFYANYTLQVELNS